MRVIRTAMLALLALVGSAVSAQAPSVQSAPLTPRPAIAAAPVPVTSALPATPAQRQLTAADADAWLDGYMPFALHSSDIAGAVVVIVKDGQVLTARGFGYADIAKRRPIDPARTLFRIGSVSKLFTWTAVMQQVEAGKLDLDRDVNAYLDFKIPPYDGKPITLRQIMTHTAGFEETAKDIITYNPAERIDYVAYLKRWTPRRIFAPGTTPAYSNWATTLAAYIVQRASGVPFDSYIEQRIFAPLDMRYATFRQPLPANLVPFMATGYKRASEPAKGFEFIGPAPAGSVSVSGLDMARFMIADLEQGRGILRPETARMMQDSPLGRVDPKSLIPPLNRMELGFFESNQNGHEVIGHLGDVENFHTSLHLFTRDGVGFFVSFNSAGRQGAAGVLRWQMLEDFADRYFPATTHDGRVDGKTAAQHAQLMVGNWENSRHSQSSFANFLTLQSQTVVSLDGQGRLVVPSLTSPGGASETWTEIAPFVWRAGNGHDRLAAQVRDGRVVRWSADEIAPFMVFDRVPFWRSAAWLMPALEAGMVILLVTALYWPVTWYVRRRYQAPLAASNARRAYRATRVMAVLVLAVLGGWFWFETAAIGDNGMLTPKSDPLLWLLQIASVIVFPGAVVIAGWNAWMSWRDGRGWTRKLWNTLVLLATLLIFYLAVAFGLTALTVNY